jgi:L-ribulose-5-phosphate 3-epimerase
MKKRELKDFPMGLYEKALPSDLSWRERLEMAGAAGYDCMEISIDESDERLARLEWNREQKDSLVQAMAASRVPILSMCLSGHRRYPIGSENEETRQRGLDIMKKAIAFAADTGIRIVQVAGYDVFYEESNEKTQALFLTGLEQSVRWAAAAGVTLAIETMDYDFMNTVTKVMRYVHAFKSPWLQVYPDIGNLSSTNQNIEHELRQGQGHIVAVHVKDSREGMVRRVPFGEGTVDFVDFFRQLAKIGFYGPVVVEMWTDDSEDAFQIVSDARRWVREKMQLAWC